MASAFIQGNRPPADGADAAVTDVWVAVTVACRAAGLELHTPTAPPRGGDLAGTHGYFDDQRRALLGAEVLVVDAGRPSADTGAVIALAHAALIPTIAHWPRDRTPEPFVLGLLTAAKASLLEYGSEHELASRLAALLHHEGR